MKQACCTLFVLVLFAACSKKRECSFHYQHLPARLDIVGFTAEELDTIYVRCYKANGNFDLLQLNDTIYSRNLTMNNDTLVFYWISAGIDYRVSIPATGNEYRITEISDPCKDYSWTTTTSNCPLGNYGQCEASEGYINGKQTSTTWVHGVSFAHYFFHLVR